MALGFDNLYKIGLSGNLSQRLKHLQASNPRLRLIASIRVKAAKTTENKIHEYLACKRIDREIFELNKTDIANLTEYQKQMSIAEKQLTKVEKKLEQNNPG